MRKGEGAKGIALILLLLTLSMEQKAVSKYKKAKGTKYIELQLTGAAA